MSELKKRLIQKISRLNPMEVAERTGCEMVEGGVSFYFLRKKIEVKFQPYLFLTEGKEDEKLEILVLHYLFRAKNIPVSGRWISFKEVPSGIFYYPSFRSRTEDVLKTLLPGKEEKWKEVMRDFGGKKEDDYYILLPFPRIPVKLGYFPPEEMLPPQVSFLFDSTIPIHLETEDIALLAEIITSWIEEEISHG
ncbi:DUF3786 domain-containing protein [Candidatus Calescamantes bacterium]|nr:DUF3786 domain-containing protein [Candidatus Calescamantes bacterium]